MEGAETSVTPFQGLRAINKIVNRASAVALLPFNTALSPLRSSTATLTVTAANWLPLKWLVSVAISLTPAFLWFLPVYLAEGLIYPSQMKDRIPESFSMFAFYLSQWQSITWLFSLTGFYFTASSSVGTLNHMFSLFKGLEEGGLMDYDFKRARGSLGGVRRHVWYALVTTTVAAISNCLSAFYVFDATVEPFWSDAPFAAKLAWCLTSSLCTTWSLCNPTYMVSMFFVRFVIECFETCYANIASHLGTVGVSLEDFNSTSKNRRPPTSPSVVTPAESPKKDGTRSLSTSELIRQTYALEKAKAKFNEALAPLALNLYLLSLVIQTASIYGVFELFFHSWTWDGSFILISNKVVMSCIYVINLFLISSWGQAMIDARSTLKDSLEDKILFMTLEETTEVEREAGLLFDRLKEPSPLSPYSFFNICHANFVSMTATIITYIIVLMQFNTSG